jgi:hypothetical protein
MALHGDASATVSPLTALIHQRRDGPAPLSTVSGRDPAPEKGANRKAVSVRDGPADESQ